MKQQNLKLGLMGVLLSLVLVGCTTPVDNEPVNTQVQVPDENTNSRTAGGPDDSITEQGSGTGSEALEGVDNIFYFEFDRAVLKAEARAALTAHAAQLRSNPRNIRLEGHADERGTREYNLALAERRANTVKDFLALQGVDTVNIEVVSYGEEKPAVFGSDSESYALNRRVELK